MAAPVLYRLRQYGRRVPQDISIIGFDDSTLSAAVGLTTLHQDPFAMGVAPPGTWYWMPLRASQSNRHSYGRTLR